MSFWKHNTSSSPQIDAILAKEDLTLNELFDQDCLFQELKSSNKTLIDFITRNDVLSELVRLVTEEPSAELDEKERYKLANLACEVLTTDTPAINEKLSDKLHLSKLYSFLESDPPLNPLLASFFSRTLSMLICRKHDQYWYSYQFTCLQVLDFLKSQPKSLDLLLKHLGTSAIMELTLKLLTQVEGQDLKATLINLLENECLIDNLIGLLESSVDEDRHFNVSILLCETIYKTKEDFNNSVDNGEKRLHSNPILDKIQSVGTIEKLLANCFGEVVSESSIISGISVLLALLCPPPSNNMARRGCDELASGSGDSLQMQAMQSQTNLLPILATIIPYLPRLHDLLIHPPKREGIKLACGLVDPPLGQSRLYIIKLLSTLISTNTPEINDKLDELNTVQILLDLFFHYVWNNFLHALVEKCIALALNTSICTTPTQQQTAQNNPLLANIFVKCKILERILEAWQDNETEQSKGMGRRGYMGHLINIANNIERHCEEESISKFVQENVKQETLESWNDFLNNTLHPINDIHNKCLGGQHPAQISDDDDLSMKGTFDMQEPTIKLHSNQDGNAMTDADLRSNFQQDFSTIIENILPNFQDHLNFQEEDMFLKQICSLKDSTWQDMPTLGDPPCNSSDEDIDDDEDTVVWSTCSSGSGLLDSSNPWSGNTGSGMYDSTGLTTTTTANDEGWANFDMNFSQGFPSDPSVFISQDTSVPVTTLSAPISNNIDSGVSNAMLDDDDCNPPTEFEFEDSHESEEEMFHSAFNTFSSELPHVPNPVVSETNPDSVVSNAVDALVATESTPTSTDSVPVETPVLVESPESKPSSTEASQKETSASSKEIVDNLPLTETPAEVTLETKPVENVVDVLKSSSPVDIDISGNTLTSVNESQQSRLLDKGSDSTPVKLAISQEEGKENKVPQTSEAFVGDVKEVVDDPV